MIVWGGKIFFTMNWTMNKMLEGFSRIIRTMMDSTSIWMHSSSHAYYYSHAQYPRTSGYKAKSA